MNKEDRDYLNGTILDLSLSLKDKPKKDRTNNDKLILAQAKNIRHVKMFPSKTKYQSQYNQLTKEIESLNL